LIVFDLDRFDKNPDTAELDRICGDSEGLTGLYIDALYGSGSPQRRARHMLVAL